MTAPIHLCVVGSANVDLTFRVARLPVPGETLAGRAFLRSFGGKGANQAVAAARLGAQVSLVARLGNDSLGQDYLSHLRNERIETSGVQLDDEQPTGTAAILVDDGARNCIVVVPGANGRLSADDVRSMEDRIKNSHAVLAQLEVPLAATIEAFRLARLAGVRTVLTPAPAVDLPTELLERTDVCVPNQSELATLTGRPAEHLEEVLKAARALQQRGPKTVIVTLGERGAMVVEADEAHHIPAPSVRALDTTGAGDAFTGALSVFLAEGNSLKTATERAVRIAAWTVQHPGTQTSYPTRSDVEIEPRSIISTPNA